MQILHVLHAVSSQIQLIYDGNLHHDYGEPDARTQTFHHHVGWNLCSDVEGEEYGECGIVSKSFWTCSRHMKILLEVEEFSISNIGAVQE